MTQAELQDYFKSKGFNVYLFDEEDNDVICAEIEDWTTIGVDMIILLRPFSIEAFKEYVDNFDVDEEIELHREDPKYKQAFTIAESLKDFTEFKERLEKMVDELENK